MTVAAIQWGFLHFLAHFGIFFGYLVAMGRNQRALGGLMRLRWVTMLSGAGFFLFCGVTHLSLAFGVQDSPVVTVCDVLQSVAIWSFLINLTLDSRRVVNRLARALAQIREEYDGIAVVPGIHGLDLISREEAVRMDVGDTVARTISVALQGEDAPWPETSS